MPQSEGELIGVVSGIGVAITAMAGVVMTILKRGTIARLDQLKSQLDGMGRRFGTIEHKVESNSTTLRAMEVFRGESTQDRAQLWREVGEGKARMANIEKQLSGMHTDIMSAITEGNARITGQIHGVDIRVERLSAARDVGEVIEKAVDALGETIAEAIQGDKRRGQ